MTLRASLVGFVARAYAVTTRISVPALSGALAARSIMTFSSASAPLHFVVPLSEVSGPLRYVARKRSYGVGNPFCQAGYPFPNRLAFLSLVELIEANS